MVIYKITKVFESFEALVNEKGIIEFANRVLKSEQEDGEYEDLVIAVNVDEASRLLEKMGYDYEPMYGEWEDNIVIVE